MDDLIVFGSCYISNSAKTTFVARNIELFCQNCEKLKIKRLQRPCCPDKGCEKSLRRNHADTTS